MRSSFSGGGSYADLDDDEILDEVIPVAPPPEPVFDEAEVRTMLRIRSTGRVLSRLFGLAVPAMLVGFLGLPLAGVTDLQIGVGALSLNGLAMPHRLILSFVALLFWMPALLLAWQMRRLSSLYAHGYIFDQQNVDHVRMIGKLLMWHFAAFALGPSALLSVLSWLTTGQASGLSYQGDISILAAGVIVHLIGWVMSQARSISADGSQHL